MSTVLKIRNCIMMVAIIAAVLDSIFTMFATSSQKQQETASHCGNPTEESCLKVEAGFPQYPEKDLQKEIVPTSMCSTGCFSNNQTSPVIVVTAFSDNHYLEGMKMLQSLIDNKYQGSLVVYLMRQPNEELSHRMKECCEEIAKSSLCAQVVEYEAEEAYDKYCFKPKVIADSLSRTTGMVKPKYLMWSDTSTRFKENPEVFGERMIEDGVDFSGRTSPMGMGENTHPATYHYLQVPSTKYKDQREIASGHFLVSLSQPVVKGLLQPWIDCGLKACDECMAPRGSSKQFQKGYKILGPPSTVFLAHRQDQSALDVLAYEWKFEHNGTVVTDNKKYMNVLTKRRDTGDGHLLPVNEGN